MTYTYLPESPSTKGGGRLGRHIDRRESFSRRLITDSEVPDPPTHLVEWTRMCPPFDQGSVGSCTGNASCGALMTTPLHQPGWAFTEADAVSLYSKATQFNAPGDQYPPTDWGSSGPCIADALEKDGVIAAAHHTTSLRNFLGLMTRGPMIVGVQWYTSFDSPLPSGECPITPDATVRGGHEIQAFKVDPVAKMVWFYQSWGPTWGALGNGTFCLSYATLETQFANGADATSFVLAHPVTTPNF